MSNIAHFVMPGRQLSSWIAGFLSYTSGIQSPEIFRKWAAVTAIAGALERKVWLRSQGEDVFPNVYVFLVGPPAAGKTRALMACWRLWQESLTEHNIAEISLTKAALIDRLAASERVMYTPEVANFHSLLIAAPELGALLPSYDSDFMNTLTHLYDGHLYTEKRRSSKQEFAPIARPNINMIACTTPGFLMSSLPASAWNEGFLSRVCIVYSGEITIKEFDLLEEKPAADPEMGKALIADLKKISEEKGKIGWTQAAAHRAEAYNKAKFDIYDEVDGKRTAVLPEPKHPRLMHYCSRRPIHFLKLCMISAIDRGVKVIDIPDVDYAIGMMYDLESNMSDVFAAMASGGDAQVISDCEHWINTQYVTKYKDEGGVPAHLVHEFLLTRAPATHVQRIYELMVSSKMLTVYSVPGGHAVRTRTKMH